MKFGQTTIPPSLFKLARDRMLEVPSFTPNELRQHLITAGQNEMLVVCSIVRNHQIIADRVMRSAIEELVSSGEIKSEKRGVWARVEQAHTEAQPRKRGSAPC